MAKKIYSTLGIIRPSTESDLILADEVQPVVELAEITDEVIISIAEKAHEANRQISTHDNNPSWAEASEEIRNSAIDGVRAIVKNPEITPEQSHENWLAFKQAKGWVYGETKDEVAKTHPCIVPYNELPESERIKDDVFTDTVKSALAAYVTAGMDDRDTEAAIELEDLPDQSVIDSSIVALEALEQAASILEQAETDGGLTVDGAKLLELTLSQTVGVKDIGLLIPSVESFSVGNKLALTKFSKESIQSKVVAIYEKLKEIARVIADFIAKWVRVVTNQLARSKAYLNYVRKSIASSKDSTKVGVIELNSRMVGITSPSNLSAARSSSAIARNAITQLDEISSNFSKFSAFANSFFKENPNSISGDYGGSNPIDKIDSALSQLKGRLYQSAGNDTGYVFSPGGLGWVEAGIITTKDSRNKITGVKFVSNVISGETKQTTFEGLSYKEADSVLSQMTRIVSVIESRVLIVEQVGREMQKLEVAIEAAKLRDSKEKSRAQNNRNRVTDIYRTLSFGRAASKSAEYVVKTTVSAIQGTTSLVHQSKKGWA